MNKTILKKSNLLKIFSNSLIYLPTPVNISYWWNFGSLLGLCLIIQIMTGLFLSMHYTSNVMYSFESIIHIIQNINYGWLMRLIHMNGASLFFMIVYLHIGRGLYYGSFKLKKTWNIGTIILLILMATAFLGYVLPWGQMSFWGATVITNLVSVTPYIGQTIVEWLWGGFSVNAPTLTRFYTFHFLTPFILLMLMIIHLLYLHEKGSNNPLGTKSNFYKIIFHNYFTLKDLLGFFILFTFMIFLITEFPYMLSDPENFIMANNMLTPIHIQPEWYFLFAYTILRSIPNKMSGVIALLMSILILLILPYMYKKNNFKNLSFYPLSQIYFWSFFFCVLLLTLLGSQPVKHPFIVTSQMLTFYYFLYFFMNLTLMLTWDKFINMK